MKVKKALLVLIPAVLGVMPIFAYGAQIYLDPAAGKYPPGVTFGVDIRLDNQGQCINAADIEIAYPKNLLEAVDTSEGNSIFSLWIKEPTAYQNYGLVSMVGGLPGGYCGRVAGDPVLSNKIATIYFKFPTSTSLTSTSIPQTANLSFLSDTRAVVNDGLGTLASLKTAGASYTQLLTGQYAPANALENAIQNDTTAPEPFSVHTYRDQSLFGDQLFAVFSTVDKQTGVDHYEVAEVPTKSIGLGENKWSWVRAVSPYLIHNQGLDGILAVRAIDKAGNERLASYNMQKILIAPDWRLRLVPYMAAIGAIGFVIIQIVLRLL